MAKVGSKSFTLSYQQQLIHEEFRSGTQDVVVVARAGVGKTTTAITGVAHAPERQQGTVLFCCFNTRIAAEGNAKLKELGITNAKFQTIHSIGAQAVYRFWEGVHPADERRGEDPWARQQSLTNFVCGGTAPDAIKRLVSKLHTLGREIVPHATKGDDLFDLAVEFECVPDEQWEEQGFTLNYVCNMAAAAMERAATVKPADGLIDFSDMIFLPVRNKWLAKTYPMVVVDEMQDLTVAKLEVAQGVCKGRLFGIGDDMQAIYGFCGADVNSLSRLKTELNAKELKLTKTFRCGKAIVAVAQQFVPDFEADENNCEGEVYDLPIEKLVDAAGPGNFILSRMNAPLVSVAMKLLRKGKRTRIAGRDIGKGLIALVRKLAARSIPETLKRITAWEEKECARLKAKYETKLDSPAYTTRLDAIHDQAAMLSSLTDNADNVQHVIDRIESLFTNDGLGDAGVITCSSVHKAKGLEADKVFVLADTLRDFDQEEKNIHYVAVTRAIETLVYVRGL